ncbi:uncharacterized protein LOC122504760 [Leptopilina heterotoma]|uniref:uncharacterized protein LOC122504760 n=1 Tax=Leptopilina heterotoma TaxID=63436 RepID=UPI001CA991F6|nr:uncharacterized protein LOC122504760 [Leptopilina heterotoma]
MSSLIYSFIIIASQCWLTIFASPARYDQRQTGDVNVQIDVKNVEVIALVKSDLLDDYMNYDYVYDYADFTLKPVTKPTTKLPPVSSNNNSESTTIVSSTKPMQAENLNISLESSTTSIPLLSLAIEDKKSTTAILTTSLETTTKGSDIAESTSVPVSNNDPTNLTEKNISTTQGTLENSVGNKRERITKRCKGLDKTGRCLRRRLSLLPLAMRVAPELIRSISEHLLRAVEIISRRENLKEFIAEENVIAYTYTRIVFFLFFLSSPAKKMLKQLLIFSLLAILTHCKSVYDQRQDGRLNVHAQLENIMIVIATPGDKGPTSLFNDIASQILELRGLTSRNKQVSIADEEILEEGKDPLNVKILRIETNPDNLEKSSESSVLSSSESLSGAAVALESSASSASSESSEIQRNTKELPKNQEIKFHFEDLSNAEKKITNNHQILDKLGIASKINSQTEKLIKNEKISTDNKDSVKNEKAPEKFISFGTISSIDDKVIYAEKKYSSEINNDSQQEKNEKILQQNEEFSKQKPDFKIKNQKSSDSQFQQNNSQLDEKEKSEKNKNDKPIVETIIRKIRQIRRGLENSLKEENHQHHHHHQKSRMSLKKELPRFENGKNDEEAGDKNEVRHIADQKSQFLKPIGEMIENCGPGRVRNRYGICQFDESLN